ncbi:branched-chain amino acid aminotransferase II [Bimuria novae-zelandiae CBS 107.79]|uniref:Branched-chain-amino-acid aminotransferase n=1 Tax=Bimuria novae-zelandiae CBS 107.79 TaxID=1447943 RepID=A0A6A5V2V8_9PLEO|nr:branched-chain amino acid aminotransferase II [Bimuria novae-zelandiae CBS 107.79]
MLTIMIKLSKGMAKRRVSHGARPHLTAELDASKLRVTKALHPSKLPLAEELAFGSHTTDHILQVRWTADEGWFAPQIVPYQKLALDPAAAVLLYGFEYFEGMKAKPGYSLYLRLVIIATNSNLGVTAPTAALLYCVACPVGLYFSAGFKAINLEATASAVATRAWPGGAGNYKIGGNYASCIAPEKAAKARGFQQLLWLFGDDDRITEAGTMNLFVVLQIGDEERFKLVTPPLDGMILPGVTRDCVLSLVRERLAPAGWIVSERDICMTEVVHAAVAGKLIEAFGTGTAAIVSPIRTIKYRDRLVHCGLSRHQNASAITALMKGWIEARQYAVEEHC